MSRSPLPDLLTPPTAGPPSTPPADEVRPRSRRRGRTGRLTRTIHVYVSMISMLIVAFFAFTGLTLNHPTWSLGGTTTHVSNGAVPAGAIDGSTIDYLAISEYARTTFGVAGHVTDYGTQGDTGSIDYAGPGYSANVTFSTTAGTLTASTTQSDLLAILNDVHKGRDTDSSWGWVIDVSAILLLVVTLTGIGIQVLQRKRRRSALLTAGALSLLTVVLMWVAIH